MAKEEGAKGVEKAKEPKTRMRNQLPKISEATEAHLESMAPNDHQIIMTTDPNLSPISKDVFKLKKLIRLSKYICQSYQ